MPCDRVRFSVKGFAYAVRRERGARSLGSPSRRRCFLRRERDREKETNQIEMKTRGIVKREEGGGGAEEEEEEEEQNAKHDGRRVRV